MTAYRAARLPSHRGPPGWAEILGPGPAAQPLEGDRTADIVIIGAGFAGLAAARRLRELDPALDLLILDASRIAEGAAGRNSGVMVDVPHELTSEDYSGSGDDKTLIALNRHAQDFVASAVEDYDIPRAYFDRAGKINGAASARAHDHNASFAAHLDTLGERWEMLDAAAMSEVTGSRHYRSGLYTPGSVLLQSAGLIRGIAAGLRRDGVTIAEDTPATELKRSGSGWTVTTPRGSVSTSRIILANNGHLESFGIARGRLMHIFLYAVMTPVLTGDQSAALGGQPRWAITPSDPMGTTVRRIDAPQGGDRIITRTCASLRPGMTTSAADLSRAARVMQAKFDSRFPALAGLKMEHAWAGHLCLSLNGVSVLKEIEQGVFSACVQNGLGTTRGTLTGIGAAELALGQASEITRYFSDAEAPKRLPPRPFQDIGAAATLRWREWKARDE